MNKFVSTRKSILFIQEEKMMEINELDRDAQWKCSIKIFDRDSWWRLIGASLLEIG